MKLSLEQEIINSIAYYAKGKYAIAVSGGSDSLALLYACSNYDKNSFVVVHFDHNLREESASEADFVEKTSHSLGFKFIKKTWQVESEDLKSGNLYQKARHARYNFFKEVIKEHNLDGILVAHSKTDLAETFLMRVGKGCSVKGASIFKQGVEIFGIKVFRPLLKFSREDLQQFLASKKINWVTDPSNVDEKKLRPRIRKILPVLEKSGITMNGISSSVKYFSQANDALSFYADKELDNFNYCKNLLYFQIDNDYFLSIPLEVKIRILEKMDNHFETAQQVFKHLPRRKNIINNLGKLQENDKFVFNLNNITIEAYKNNIFVYKSEFKKDKNKIYLDEIDKKIRYNIIKKYNLQRLPIKIRNRIYEKSSFRIFSDDLTISF